MHARLALVVVAACGGRAATHDAASGCVDHGSRAGTGRFAAPAYYRTGENPYALAVADFNGDCAPDAAVAHFIGSDGMSAAGVGVFINQGDGTFAPPAMYPLGAAVAIIASDIDGNGTIDLVVDDRNMASVLLGNGDGTFASPLSVIAAGPLVVADVDDDGHPDLIAGEGSPETIVVLHGNGDGTFGSPGPPLAAAGSWFPVIATDLDHDGHADLVGTLQMSGPPYVAMLGVLRGHGDATFEPPIMYPCASYVVAAAAADLDGDGTLDLAMVGCNAILDVWHGNGDGTVIESGTYMGETGDTVGLARGDLDGDGLPDLAVADRTQTQPLSPDNHLSWFHNTGSGFAPFTSVAVSTSPSDIAIADVDGDGRLDLVSTNAQGGWLSVVRGAP